MMTVIWIEKITKLVYVRVIVLANKAGLFLSNENAIQSVQYYDIPGL